ncbi:MAG: hypothetical protein ACYC54_15975, partial [Sedimentisphaerales bacterium]
GTIGHIKLGKKRIGKRSARNSHATFEAAGAGNGLTAPALDPTQKTVVVTNGVRCQSFVHVHHCSKYQAFLRAHSSQRHLYRLTILCTLKALLFGN